MKLIQSLISTLAIILVLGTFTAIAGFATGFFYAIFKMALQYGIQIL